MNLRLIATVVALFGIYALLIGVRSSANQDRQQAKPKFTLSTQGTLLELYDANVANRTKKLGGEGFALDYKTRGRVRRASAIGTQIKGLRSSPAPVKLDENKASATGQTADKSLEITTDFTFDASAGELIIKRKFRNVSNYPVTLQQIWSHTDPSVLVRGGASPSRDLVSASKRQITAILSLGDCDMHDCPPEPLCIIPPGCPRPFSARLYPSQKEVLLGWSRQITLQPKQRRRSAGEASVLIRIMMK